MIWTDTPHRPKGIALADVLGFIPHMVDDDDPRPAKVQLDANYQHGGGWRPIPKFVFNQSSYTLKFPGDPVLHPWAQTTLRAELILVYECGITCIVQPDGSFEVARLD